MEIPKEKYNFPIVGNIDTPTSRVTNLIKEIDDITRPVGVYYRDKRPNKRPKNLFIFRLFSSLTTSRFRIVWTLRSSGRRSKIVTYLFHKWLFGTLNREERVILFDLPEVTRNNMIFSALRARSIGFSMKTIRKTLRIISPLIFREPTPTLERWNGFKTFYLEINKEVSPNNERKGIKYSGWKRHQNDQGSLGPEKEDPFYLIPNDENDVISLFLQICKEVNSGKSEIHINQLKVKI